MPERAFTPDDRDRIRSRILELARSDARIVAAAEVGSRALGGGDRWSDLDLTFGLAPGAGAAEVLDGWARRLAEEERAAHLFDLPFRSTVYRVFLLPGALQVDLSVTPGAEFGALGPKFRLLWGEAVPREAPRPPSARDAFGQGVHHAVRARICLERGRPLAALHWIHETRAEALALACMARGLESRHARGLDDLPAGVAAALAAALPRSLGRDDLLAALGCAVGGLLREAPAGQPAWLAEALRGLTEASAFDPRSPECWSGGLAPPGGRIVPRETYNFPRVRGGFAPSPGAGRAGALSPNDSQALSGGPRTGPEPKGVR